MAALDFSNSNLVEPITDHVNLLLHNLPVALVTLLLGLVVVRILSYGAKWLVGFIRMPRGLKEIVVSIINTVLIIILIIIVLQTLGLNNAAFVFTAAVAGLGIAVGNGAIPLATDIVSGIYLARDRDFGIGDIVRVGEPGLDRIEGEVLSMDMRRTRIKDSTGEIHSWPNTLIERHSYTLVTKRRDRTDIPKT